MLKYNPDLKERARRLRTEMTEAEQRVWVKVRRKQILGVQFYRQKPIGNYIVDFYARRAKIVLEIDGSQHLSPSYQKRDGQRDSFLQTEGLTVLRFNNLQILREIEAVLAVIYEAVKEGLEENPPHPLYERGRGS